MPSPLRWRTVHPRGYTATERDSIAHSVNLHKLSKFAVVRLQKAVANYQWGSIADNGIFSSSTNKGRRELLELIVELCQQGAPGAEIEGVINVLDGPTCELLGIMNIDDYRGIQHAAECALVEIHNSRPDPKRARRQFVRELARIYELMTGQRPTRRVTADGKDYGPFLDFVKAALPPFKAAMGCEADIKAVLEELKQDQPQEV